MSSCHDPHPPHPLADEAIAPETIRDWDRRATQEYGLPSIVLMENAGAGAARLLVTPPAGRPSVGPPWIIACGPGNNGGDGFVVARHLDARGEAVEVWLAFEDEHRDAMGDAAVNLRVISRAGIPIHRRTDPPRVRSGTIVDALLGTGLTRPIEGRLAHWIEALASCGRPIVSLDLPSGLDAATGRVLGRAIRADWTLTFAAAKTGFFVEEGPTHIGALDVVPIGLPRSLTHAGPERSPR